MVNSSSWLDRCLSAIPSQCEICRAWPSQALCNSCVARFAQPQLRCQTCALALEDAIVLANTKDHCKVCARSFSNPSLKDSSSWGLDSCVASVDYAYPWADLITRFKFKQSTGLAAAFAQLMLATPWAQPALDQADLLLPMPLSSARLKQRGFNQALELAKRLKTLQAPFMKLEAQLLLRVIDTAPQSSLSRPERLRNVRHAFAVNPQRIREVLQRRVVLVDDVMTSGASLNAAAHALRVAGAAHVTGLVLARTPEPDHLT
ncbi:MAG: ComF family protein [Betaproteobacteria bacterium]|nr:ComF family protein [Betaproteobacteria bacterium]